MSIKEHPPQLHTKQYDLHVPVLLSASLDLFKPQPKERYLDLTAGYGGHAEAFLNKTQSYSSAVLVDRDENAIAELGRFSALGATLINADFVSAAKQLVSVGEKFGGVITTARQRR